MKTIEIECKSCKGTGLYQGIGERDGAFVQCHTCKGTGRSTFTYTEFTGRKEQPKCRRVYLSGGGYVITDKDITNEEGKYIPFSKYGCTYEEWKQGKTPEHIKCLGCPMSMDQSACHEIKGFTDRCDSINGGWFSHIPSCKCSNKEECWKLFEDSGLVKR